MDTLGLYKGSFIGPIRQFSSYEPLHKRFRCIDFIEEFGFKTIVLAKDRKDQGTKNALKFISRSSVSDSAFKYEVDVMRKVSHPSLMPVLNAATFPSHHVLVMDYFPLGSLDQYIGNIQRETADILLIQITSGLQHLHERNIVHRDIKPENILMASETKCVITDFEFATYLPPGMQRVRRKMGTKGFMAPEMLINPKGSYDGFKLDTFALGVTLFCIWAHCKNASKIQPEEFLEVIDFCDALYPGTLGFYKTILTNLLHPNPEQRWAMENLLEEMKAQPSLDNARKIVEKELTS